MTARSYLVASAVALAFSGAAFAQSSTSPSPTSPSGRTESSAPGAPLTAAQCESLTGDRKEQCMRQVQQSRPGSATGATSSGASGSGAASRSESAPGSTGSSSGSPR